MDKRTLRRIRRHAIAGNKIMGRSVNMKTTAKTAMTSALVSLIAASVYADDGSVAPQAPTFTLKSPAAFGVGDPQPGCVLCLAAGVIIGVAGAGLYYMWCRGWQRIWSGPPPTNGTILASPPLLDDDSDGDWDGDYTPSFVLGLTDSALPANPAASMGVQWDVSTNGWTDPQGSSYMDEWAVNIQTAPTPAGPWSDTYTLICVESGAGSMFVVRNSGSTTNLRTTYRAAGDTRPVNLLATNLPSAQFYRTAVPQELR